MNLSDEVLGAYVDGELEPAERAVVADAITRDPAVAARIAALEALNRKLRSAFGDVLAEPVPASLAAAVRGAAAPSVVDLGDVRAARRRPALSRPSAGGWAALAASVVVGLVVGHFTVMAPPQGSLAIGAGGISAGASLTAALNSRAAHDPAAADGVEIGLSFRSTSGGYCRTFAVADRASYAGLACREGDQWQIGTLTQVAGASGASGAFRQAATTLPPAVREAVAASISGEPLDADAERAAMQHGWR